MHSTVPYSTMMMMIALLFLIRLQSISSLPFSACDLCPLQSSCVLDLKGKPSCICNDGFTGDNCDFLLCHGSFCLGPRSICENTLQGPVCHCQKGRTGSNCELLKGEAQPWSRCSNATYCEASFQNGKCDEICNNPECLFDGNECDQVPAGDQSSSDVTTSSIDRPCLPADNALIALSALLLIIIITLLLCIRSVQRKANRLADRPLVPPVVPIPPTPQLSQSIYYANSEASTRYATIPSIAHSVTGYMTLPSISHTAAASINSDYGDFV